MIKWHVLSRVTADRLFFLSKWANVIWYSFRLNALWTFRMRVYACVEPDLPGLLLPLLPCRPYARRNFVNVYIPRKMQPQHLIDGAYVALRVVSWSP